MNGTGTHAPDGADGKDGTGWLIVLLDDLIKIAGRLLQLLGIVSMF
jgi:hypothetical protein